MHGLLVWRTTIFREPFDCEYLSSDLTGRHYNAPANDGNVNHPHSCQCVRFGVTIDPTIFRVNMPIITIPMIIVVIIMVLNSNTDK